MVEELKSDTAAYNKALDNLFQYLRVMVQHKNGLKRLNKAIMQLEYLKMNATSNKLNKEPTTNQKL